MHIVDLMIENCQYHGEIIKLYQMEAGAFALLVYNEDGFNVKSFDDNGMIINITPITKKKAKGLLELVIRHGAVV